jgi:phage baseplate assembly protein W
VNRDPIGKGWPFPIRPGTDNRLYFLGEEEKIRQSIWLILSTAPGERLMLPEFGCGIHDLVFEANTASLRAVVQTRVREALDRWEARIDVLDVQVQTPPEQRNYLLIRIDYRIRATNAFFNLVFPFFLTEGPG